MCESEQSMREHGKERALFAAVNSGEGFKSFYDDIFSSKKLLRRYLIKGGAGSGKSTLMHILGCLDSPTSGSYRLHGRDVSRLSGKELARVRGAEIGFVFQGFQLIPRLTALENVEYPLMLRGVPEAKRRQMALDALDMVRLARRKDHRPSQLSGGQQQRVSIARALCYSPALLLCDEPTGALDESSRDEVLALLEELHDSGHTIVVITHEMSVIQEICDRVAIIDGGLIAEEGTVEEIFRNPKTKIGQELVLHEGTNREAYTGKLPFCYRLVFKGGSENEPVLGQMMIETKGVANILAANTRTIDDEAFGQMVLQFPEEKELRETMIKYLRDRGVVVEEVEYV